MNPLTMLNRPAEILLAEDNPADQRLTQRVFKDSGILNNLHIASDGEEALGFLDKAEPFPDILLLDINMPKIDGKQVLETIKTTPRFRHLPVVMLTTSSHERDVFDSYQLGVNAYITKPVDIGQFRTIVKQLHCFWLVTVSLPPSHT